MKKRKFMRKRGGVIMAAAVFTGALLQSVPLSGLVFAETQPGTELATDTSYLLRCVNSNQYLTVANGTAANSTNVVQYEANGIAEYNTWRLVSAGDGYYYIYSALSGGSSFLLDVTNGLTADGTNIGIYENTYSDAQLFKFVANGDGSYQIVTKISTDEGALTVEDASTESGGNVAVYERNTQSAQQWVLEPITNQIPGDVNADGALNAQDLALLKKIVLTQRSDGIRDYFAADVTGEQVIDAQDAIALDEFLLRKRTSFDVWQVTFPSNSITPTVTGGEVTDPVETTVTLADMPSDYTYAMEWIWTNRVENEQSTARWNTLFDQIVAGDGTLNYVVRWQSYKTITLAQRQALEVMLDEAINGWTDWLVGYENWPYSHVDVKIVGWAVLDRSCLLDLQDDEIVYDSLISDYDSTYDTSNGYETIPDKLPSAPDELSRFYHFSNNIGYDYPGGLDKRFDMYLWATQGFPSIGGCGGDWGQRLSDDAYLNMLDGTGLHVLEHELGHGFGMTDFYGGEGESDGFPPGGFPGGENSLMMAGSAAKITDFDGWSLRYFWSQLKDQSGRFDFS